MVFVSLMMLEKHLPGGETSRPYVESTAVKVVMSLLIFLIAVLSETVLPVGISVHFQKLPALPEATSRFAAIQP